MEVVVDQPQRNSNIKPGTIIHFPQYKTWYVVHRKHSEHGNDWYFMARLDGEKQYTLQPQTIDDIVNLVVKLNGEVYTREQWMLKLIPRNGVQQ